MNNLFQVDSFADRQFTGNPAGVCLLDEPREDSWMLSFAEEMNLSETAFVGLLDNGAFPLRWFTPKAEVDLCGHATMAAAHILWETGVVEPQNEIRFQTRSGILTCQFSSGFIAMNFPANPVEEVDEVKQVIEALNVKPIYFGKNSFDYLVQVQSEQEVLDADIDFRKLGEAPVRGVILTAAAKEPKETNKGLTEFDYVSRFFAPAVGVDEDPVTGSAHCCLAVYWSQKLGRKDLVGYQASKRGGFVRTEWIGERVVLSGKAMTFFAGEFLSQ